MSRNWNWMNLSLNFMSTDERISTMIYQFWTQNLLWITLLCNWMRSRCFLIRRGPETKESWQRNWMNLTSISCPPDEKFLTTMNDLAVSNSWTFLSNKSWNWMNLNIICSLRIMSVNRHPMMMKSSHWFKSRKIRKSQKRNSSSITGGPHHHHRQSLVVQ